MIHYIYGCILRVFKKVRDVILFSLGQFKKMYQQKLREQEKAYKRQEKQIKDSKSGGKSKKQAVRLQLSATRTSGINISFATVFRSTFPLARLKMPRRHRKEKMKKVAGKKQPVKMQ